MQRGALERRRGILTADGGEASVTTTLVPANRLGLVATEAAKLPAFARRNFLEAWSYRVAFFWDIVGLAFQALTFFYIGKIVSPTSLPKFGESRVTYLEFVAIGIAVSMFVGLALIRAASAFRDEQLTGTLEMLMMTPTAPLTIQLGLVFYDLIYLPVRTIIFFGVIVAGLNVRFEPSGLLPAMVVLLLFVPFVWGLGIILSAATITFKKGGASILGSVLTLTSGAYFPVAVLPGWLSGVAKLNPMTAAINAMRDALLGGSGWAGVGHAAAVLAPGATVTLLLGIVAFRLAARRERRRGTIGLY
jgi:ABC-2 type transport system permease protein